MRLLVRFIIYTCLIALLGLLPGNAQEQPPINSFDPEIYQGGNQNWMISQGQDKFIYVANNKGLLEYNGMHWTLYPSPNETIIRAVRVIAGRVYTGCYQEFGYWERNNKGYLNYQSLSKPVQDKMVADEHFWNILPFEQYILFQSLDQIFLYDRELETFEVITPSEGIDKLFIAKGKIYFTGKNRQLYTLIRGNVEPILDQPVPGRRVIHLWQKANEIFLQTAEQGRFRLSDNSLIPSPQPGELEGKSIYSAVSMKSGQFALGTISDGVYILSPEGELLYRLKQREGLANNTVLSLFEDSSSNLWAGTDNGISCINVSAPLREYNDQSGQLGTVYDAAVFEGKLYLGTNQGLFYKQQGENSPFTFVENTKGQVWSLFVFQGLLFCGHDSGTFLVRNGDAQRIYSESGTWKFESIAGRPDMLMQGNYYGLSILEKKGGSWRFRNKIDGFDYSARFFEYKAPDEVYVSHEYKGVFGLAVDSSFQKVTRQKDYDYPLKGKNAALATFDGNILYCSREGISQLQSFSEGFRQDTSMSLALETDNYESGKLSVDSDHKLWLFTDNNIFYFRQGVVKASPNRRVIPIPADLVNAMSGYENITKVGLETYLIGTANGYLLLDLTKLEPNTHELFLAKASCRNLNREERKLSLKEGGEIPYAFNNLSVEFAVPSYRKYFVPHYQYRLEGFYDNWSDWSPESLLTFKNLPFGNYRLEIRSRVGEELSSNAIIYEFAIMRPWYWSRLAIALYVLTILVGAFFIHRAYTRYYRKQEAKLREENQRKLQAKQRETELELVRIKNEQLEKDIENKNRELAISTMSLVKKNELLHQIKEKLEAKNEPSRNIQSVIKTIDKNTDEAETWNLFKEAFENADQEFFKKVQDKHPSLTHNDLKLCAYLRLNLSSKEIAPLLNISVRSVEVKRYRLRKKMELEHDEGLVEYILGI